MPKKFNGPNADIDEAVASQKLRGLCIDIMAIRRSIEAKRNNKSGLANSRMDAGLLDSIREDMAKSSALDQFLKEVCDKLGTNGLMAQAKGDGAKLVESYALAKQDKLEPYNPVVPAPVKEGPKKVEENKGPQVGQ